MLNFLKESFSNYSHIILLYIPLGIIGVWRWTVWLIRRIVSFYYKIPGGNYQSTLSVVVPVYNEDPEVFRLALFSWLENSPNEIIAVIDYTDEKSIEVFKSIQKIFKGAKLIVTKIPGKRPALADGIRASKSEIIALVDSDTAWSPDIKKKLLGPFFDSKVGGLVTRQDILETNTLARKIFKIHLDNRYLIEYPFLAVVGDALVCLSGRTALYRREAIIGELDNLVGEQFLGQQMISGDDKTLTRLIQSKGWKTRFLRDVKVYTVGISRLGDLIKQQLRWTRNSLRSDIKVLFSRWLWKNNKVLGIYMLDKFIQPVTLLLAPIYFFVSIVIGLWQAALIILIWWIISRTIKIYPHLKEKPMDFFILPIYIPITFLMAIIKVYAFMTIDKQGWITRWDKERLNKTGFVKTVMPYLATVAICFLIFFLVFNYKNKVFSSAESQIKVMNRIQKASAFTSDVSKTSETDIAKVKKDATAANASDPYGYYVVMPKDTLAVIRKRYNLPPSGKVLVANTKVPAGFLSPSQQIAIPVNDLRNPITRNILYSAAKPPRINYDPATNTIFVRQTGSVATLAKIQAWLGPNNRRLLEQTAPKEWILRANLYIGKNATLVLDGGEVSFLKLKSDDKGFIWLRTESGNMLINNTKISSWDEGKNSPDTNYDNGRSFVLAKNSGRMDIINSDLGYLGYIGYPNRGGQFGGSYGVSWKIKNNTIDNRLLTGVVKNSQFHHNFFGLYTFGVTGMLISGNQFYENINYGLDPHDDSNNMLIENNVARNNGNHGIILSKRCVNNIIVGNISHDNRLHGIMLDRSSNNNRIEGNNVYNNIDGIALYNSNNNLVLNNISNNNNRGFRINASSTGNYAEGNKIFYNSRGFYVYGKSNKNFLVNNQVMSNDIGITLKDASQNLFLNNYKIFDNVRSGRLTVDSYENVIQ